jgi:hypothetical protein
MRAGAGGTRGRFPVGKYAGRGPGAAARHLRKSGDGPRLGIKNVAVVREMSSIIDVAQSRALVLPVSGIDFSLFKSLGADPGQEFRAAFKFVTKPRSHQNGAFLFGPGHTN